MEKIKMEAIMDNLETLIEFVLKKVNNMTKNDKKIENQMRLAMEEVLANVINYAYPNNDGFVEIAVEEEAENSIRITIIDQGTEFNPLNKEDPDITLGIDERKIGGLGIFMVKNIMDIVSYRRDDDENILTLEKKL